MVEVFDGVIVAAAEVLGGFDDRAESRGRVRGLRDQAETVGDGRERIAGGVALGRARRDLGGEGRETREARPLAFGRTLGTPLQERARGERPVDAVVAALDLRPTVAVVLLVAFVASRR